GVSHPTMRHEPNTPNRRFSHTKMADSRRNETARRAKPRSESLSVSSDEFRKPSTCAGPLELADIWVVSVLLGAILSLWERRSRASRLSFAKCLMISLSGIRLDI